MNTGLDKELFRILIAEQLEDGIKFISAGEPIDVPGFRKLQNDIRNGRSVDILAKKFIDYIHSNLNTLANPQKLDLEELDGSFERAFGLLYDFYSEKTWEDPIGTHSNLDKFDLKPLMDMMKDSGSHMRRYFELEKLNRPELVLPVAKDLFVLSYEKMYRNTQHYL